MPVLSESHSVMSDSLQPHTVLKFSRPEHWSGDLGGIFRTQGSNPGLPRCRRILYELSHWGSPLFDIHNNKCLNSNDHFQIYKDFSHILTHLILKATICEKANTGISLFYGIVDSVDNFMEKLLHRQDSLYMHSMPGTHH